MERMLHFHVDSGDRLCQYKRMTNVVPMSFLPFKKEAEQIGQIFCSRRDLHQERWLPRKSKQENGKGRHYVSQRTKPKPRNILEMFLLLSYSQSNSHNSLHHPDL